MRLKHVGETAVARRDQGSRIQPRAPARTTRALLADLGANALPVPADGKAVSPDDPARVWSDRRKHPRAVGTTLEEQFAEVCRLVPAADLADLRREVLDGREAGSAVEGPHKVADIADAPG
jgi:hypothetical protein